jgi:hypothetical protein
MFRGETVFRRRGGRVDEGHHVLLDFGEQFVAIVLVLRLFGFLLIRSLVDIKVRFRPG